MVSHHSISTILSKEVRDERISFDVLLNFRCINIFWPHARVQLIGLAIGVNTW